MCAQTLMVSLSNHEGFNTEPAAHPSTSSGWGQCGSRRHPRPVIASGQRPRGNPERQTP